VPSLQVSIFGECFGVSDKPLTLALPTRMRVALNAAGRVSAIPNYLEASG
jgi:hypothetical protein